jgi:chromate transporter
MFKVLIDLFVAFFKVGLLSFGGGYTLIPLIQHQVVEVNSWATQDEFLKVLGASQAIPGAISIKFATYIGYKEAGIPGVISTITGSFIVPIAAILILFNGLKYAETIPVAERFLKGIKSATWGLIIGFGVQSLMGTSMDFRNIAIGIGALIAIAGFDLSPAIVIIVAGALGIFLYR